MTEKEIMLDSKKTVMIRHFDILGSTNTYIKEEAKKGAEEWLVAIADSQSEGRGRLGRSFSSQGKSGLYMSILLRPDVKLDGNTVTVAAAVAVSQAIEKLTDKKCGIKWVNDIICDGRKVCGILTEGAVDEKGVFEYAVLGIGVNISVPDGGYPDELKDIAGAISESYTDEFRDTLAYEIISRFEYIFCKCRKQKLLSEYRKRLLFIGNNVKVISPSVQYFAEILDIDDHFSLIVRRSDTGEKLLLSSGEISIRAK